MSFTSPYMLLALLLVPAVLLFAIAVDRRRSRYPVVFTNLELLAALVQERRAWRRWVPLALLLVALACASTALARPKARLSVPDNNGTVILVVDVSGSMRANDVEPTRLDAAVNAMRTFLDKLPPQFKVGLVAFSSEPEVLSAPTRDRQLVREALGYLMPEAGTAIGDGLQVAVRLVQSSLARAGVERKPGRQLPAAIVLMSDGAQNRGFLQPLQAARNAKAAGVKVYTVALGTPGGVVSFGFGLYINSIPVPPDPATMRLIANATGGTTYSARSAERLSNIYKSLGSSIGRKTELREVTSWFAAAAALFLIGAIGTGRLVEGRLP
ncbi:MAG TPA: VWA domain-containing protein [Gaiellaceae bacterium]|jgi:Ca-activated chloride channel family protein|nr:VWA domain-containing protein [Gaiellaceae bacterium]